MPAETDQTQMETEPMQKSPLNIELKDGIYSITATDGLKIINMDGPTVNGEKYNLGDANNLVSMQIENDGNIYTFQVLENEVVVTEKSMPKNTNEDPKLIKGIFNIDGEVVTVAHLSTGEFEMVRGNETTTVSYRIPINFGEHKKIVVNKENGKEIPHITLLKQFKL